MGWAKDLEQKTPTSTLSQSCSLKRGEEKWSSGEGTFGHCMNKEELPRWSLPRPTEYIALYVCPAEVEGLISPFKAFCIMVKISLTR